MDGIIFDVDGTLWDSTGIVAEAWQECCRKNGIQIRDLSADRLKQLFGKTLPDIAAEIFSDETKERQLELIDACCEAEHEALRRQCAPLYPQVPEVLRKMSERMPVFIVSNCQAGYIEVFLEATGLGGFITDHLCPGDTGEAKAANIRRIVERYGLRAPAYVGDTDGDHAACKEAGVPFIFAEYGFGKTELPDHTIRQPVDLLAL
ncbi:MAG: HAD family hydrolase [Blautia sp.]|nr:HAD family hydrolase [Blautia sp.]